MPFIINLPNLNIGFLGPQVKKYLLDTNIAIYIIKGRGIMNENEPLLEKYRTQKVLDEMAGHDLAKYVSDTHSRIENLSARLGLNLKYGIPTAVENKRWND